MKKTAQRLAMTMRETVDLDGLVTKISLKYLTFLNSKAKQVPPPPELDFLLKMHNGQKAGAPRVQPPQQNSPAAQQDPMRYLNDLAPVEALLPAEIKEVANA